MWFFCDMSGKAQKVNKKHKEAFISDMDKVY